MAAARRPRPARGVGRPPGRPAPGTGLASPRGPLPARVYWTRRLVLLGLVLATALGVGRVLGSGSDGDTAVDRATTASVTTGTGSAGAPAPDPSTSPPASTPATALGPSAATATGKPQRARTRREPPPAVPTGPCEDADVRVVPTVDEAVGGGEITIGLQLRTVESAACYWTVSPDTLSLRITSGDDEIWSSRQCPRAVPHRSVVVRRATTTSVPVRWSGRRSDEECSGLTEWALPGWYHVESAALSGEPADRQFEVIAPEPRVITRTPEPESKRARQQGRDAGQESPARRQDERAGQGQT